MKEVKSIDDLVASGENELKQLADAGNSVAREWLERIQSVSPAPVKLALFGEMRVALTDDARPEARDIKKEMFPGK